MKTARICPQCRKSLPADAPEGLCPQCLLQGALTSTAGASVAGASAVQSPAAPPSPAELAPHFPQLEILELLGQGGMGAVYKARQRGLDRLVALKILTAERGHDPAFARRFEQEARALARLNHPNIVTVHDFGQAGGYYYFLMEFVDGMSLRQMLQAGRLAPQEALAIVPEICKALQFAHDEGIVHRDIKPENILLDRRGRVKIADFGIARLLGGEATTRLTQSRQVIGTPHYMAPEQLEHPLDVDHRADIFALGVVFYEMLTGELPLGRFAPPSAKVQVDVRLDEVVLRSLEKEPERRYQRASQVKTDVETIAGQSAPPSPSAPPLHYEARHAVRGPAMGLIVTALLNWLGLFVALPLMAYFSTRYGGVPSPWLAGLVALILMTGSALILLGALKMQRLENYKYARAASVLAMCIGPGYLVGWPVGIWALVVLSRREVKAAFEAQAHAALAARPAPS